MNVDIRVLYLVNGHIPNNRANGVQIAHTCEALGKQMTLTLATRMTYGRVEDSFSRYGISPTFSHVKIFCIDIPKIPFRYALRNASFFLCANIYVLGFFITNFIWGRKSVLYVRGEVILSLIPLALVFPIFFETHQIRNYAWLYRIALRRARGIVVVTERLKKKFIEEYKIPARKIVVARDAVDLEKFASVKKDSSLWLRHGVPMGKKIVLYSGTLAIEKGVDTVAQASAFVSDDVQIVFLGGTEDQIKAFKEKYGHSKNVSIIGRVDYIDVPKYIASADVLVLPDSAFHTYSNLYTSPMKLFEYMASGRPIVASRVPSLSEVLDEDSAVFFESGNPQSLALRVVQVLGDEVRSKEMSTRAREMVTEFTWEKRTKAIVAHILGEM